MASDKNFVLGIFDDEDVLLKAVTKIRKSGVKIDEVYSPFPVHGLDEVLGYKRSKISVAAFLFGLTGFSLALLMQFYMLKFDWPMIIGGKNFASVTFVPVTFELTVLLGAFGMVGTFFVIQDLKPWGKSKSPDLRSTDDKHVMAIELSENTLSTSEIESVLKDSGASEVNLKQID
ncbi:DUF3341 domain-containing protein [Xanthovirga aplysinae]|uniref:DUF3341 domain-containing protein n=1 Tax=Xanthovirga aplysinae TaxID=2529853 RepID=UPI0012BB57C1|nr:DUF3341 domain-containing protein [Xanthovirga aplysinae]MTI33284.1 DUF3341 domain-containing protein [Xanthovirga aplysinae]